MPTYNHERYLAEAIESVLAQRVRFTFELVLGEDHSTDGTLEVARAYAARHADTIVLLAHPRNLGIWDNDQAILSRCRGKYIAWLEGDDLWSDPNKLQRQVELLEANPSASACFHRARCLSTGAPPSTWRGGPAVPRPQYTVDDLLEEGPFIPSCTLMFRAELARPALEWTRGTAFLETTYAVRFALSGPIAFIDETMGTFRFHAGGVYRADDDVGNSRAALDAHRLLGRGFRLEDRAAYQRGLALHQARLGEARP